MENDDDIAGLGSDRDPECVARMPFFESRSCLSPPEDAPSKSFERRRGIRSRVDCFQQKQDTEKLDQCTASGTPRIYYRLFGTRRM